MAEYWRYPELLAKRARGDFDDVLLHGAAGYGRGELRPDERDSRLLDYGLDYGKTGGGYTLGGLTGAGTGGLMDGPLHGTASGRIHSLSGLEDPRLSGIDSSLLKGTGVGLNGGRPDILPRSDGPGAPLHPDASPTLFVEGLPSDCTRREISHVFRPFRGYKEVRIVHKDSKRPGGETLTLCFVEFSDSRCATIALEALRGYKLDESNRDSELRLQFARISAPRGGGRDDFRDREFSRRR